jgi:hypothetical protein
MLRDPFHTPANQPAQSVLSALLTQSLSALLAEADPRPLLLSLNSSMETAQVIWNSGMREELLKVGGPNPAGGMGPGHHRVLHACSLSSGTYQVG